MNYKESYAVKELTKRSRFLSFIYIAIFAFGFPLLYLGIQKCLVNVSAANVLGVVMSIGFIIADIVFIKMLITNNYGTGIKDYFALHPDTTIEELDNDLRQANHFIKSLWIGSKCTFHIGYLYPYIIENKEIIWVYLTRISGQSDGWSINFCDINKKMTSVTIKSEKKAKEIAQLYQQNFAHIVIGFNKELEDMYNGNIDKFLGLKYNQIYQ